ncbi:MAG: hypothetical protein ACHP6H_04715, partial [Legionellales bacterium]
MLTNKTVTIESIEDIDTLAFNTDVRMHLIIKAPLTPSSILILLEYLQKNKTLPFTTLEIKLNAECLENTELISLLQSLNQTNLSSLNVVIEDTNPEKILAVLGAHLAIPVYLFNQPHEKQDNKPFENIIIQNIQKRYQSASNQETTRPEPNRPTPKGKPSSPIRLKELIANKQENKTAFTSYINMEVVETLEQEYEQTQ